MMIDVPPGMELRQVTDDDHEWLVELHNDPVVLHNVTNPQKITLDQHLVWWNSIKNSHAEQRLIFTVDGTRVGFTKFYAIDFHNLHCTLGADIHTKFRGKGFAKYMWTLMLEKCFDELCLHRVSLSTTDYNVVAHRVYENLGFLVEGRMKEYHYRDGKFYDAICMYMLRDQWERRHE